MARWTLNDISWAAFDPAEVTPELLSLVKAASMVEYNGFDYARYLCEVFTNDPAFQQDARNWAEEEVQHGRALRQWAEMADSHFNFEQSFALFTEGYKLPQNIDASVRGSCSGELIARCVVEIGTSSYYTAIANATNEPVLQAICRKIAADEFAHYKLFYTHLQRYMQQENLSLPRKLAIALGRIMENEDDELAYAYFAAHYDGAPYDHVKNKNQYLSYAIRFYEKENIERMAAMTFKAVGVKPYAWLRKAVTEIGWCVLRYKAVRLARLGA